MINHTNDDDDDRYDNHYDTHTESIRLSKLLKQPYDLYHPGVLDSYLLGLANQRSGRMDPTLTTEVTNHLFEKPGKFFGIDLAAINIQRGRDMGVPGYNHFREYCGLPRAKYFEDLTGVFSNKTLLRMSQLYKHVDDIDLWTAGISEYPIRDGLVGPTFACLIARQFVNLRRGDRFWYENSGYPAQFTIEQLDELRKSTAARVICDNSDDIETIQGSAMLIADPYSNPRVSCHSLPSIDLTKWKENSYGAQPAPVAGYGEPAAHPDQPPVAEYHHHHHHQQPPTHHDEAYHHHHHHHEQPSSLEAEYPSATKLAEQAAAVATGYQATANAAELSLSEFEPLKTSTHQFVDHLVDFNNYKPELMAPQAAPHMGAGDYATPGAEHMAAAASAATVVKKAA